VVVLPACETFLLDTEQLDIHALPNVDIIMLSDSSLEVSESDASYQWYNCSSSFITLARPTAFGGPTAISGATNQTYLPVSSESSTYNVAVTDINGCSATSSCFNYLVNGINSETIRTVSVLPNPALNFITINVEEEIEHIDILNASGTIVKSEFVTDNTINIEGLNKGMYVIQIETVNGFLISKFIKE
jgi:hypothetical protein